MMKYKSIKYVILLAMLFSAIMLTVSPMYGAVPTEYCSKPPFVSNTVPPNVLIVLDNSGSMNDGAYSASYDPTRYVAGDPVKRGYYGYFDPAKNYVYTGKWEATTATIGTIANPVASGDFLNWATMRRIDVGRKLLIGGKATPRSPNPGATVALYGETSPSPSWDFSKTDSIGKMSPFPASSYSFEMRGDRLYVRPNFTVSDPSARVPKANANATWLPYASTSALYRTIDDKTINDSTDYMYLTSGNEVQMFNYTSFTTSEITTTIQSVIVRFRAQKTSNGTNRITGVLRVGGTDYYDPTNYDNLSTSWNTYQFTWTANPKRLAECIAAASADLPTCSAWQATDLTDSASAYYVNSFGVYNVTTASSSQYPKVTWVEMSVSLTAPSGGPYSTVINWKGEDWAYEQGIIANLGDEARFGLAYYNQGSGQESGYTNGRYDAGYVANIVNFSQPVNMITTIHNMTPNTWTPLGETLFEMVRYFRHDAPYYSGNSPADYRVGPSTSDDPYYFDYPSGSVMPDQYVPCAKSFILLLTDGESTKDRNIPTTATGVPSGKSLQDYDVDGRDGVTYPSDGSDYLDDVALWARTVDARPGTCTSDKATWTFPCLPGNQSIVTYSVFMFGRASQLLKDTAINGGFEDLNGDNLPGPDLREYMRDVYPYDGVLDTTNDLPLTYFEGDDGYDLEESIINAIASILRRAASGTAVSVLTTSSRGVGSMLQAYFLPIKQEGAREVTWTGYTQNIWLDLQDNLREDTVPDAQLILDQDKAVKLYYDTLSSETKVAKFTTDVNGNSDASVPGSLASCDPSETKRFGEISSIWEGGAKLALKRPSTRTIFTSKKSIVGTTTTTLDSTTLPKQPLFNTSMSATLKAALNPDAIYTEDNIVGYIRGECLETSATGDSVCGGTPNATYRDRRMQVTGGDTNGNVWKLGDVITSTPKVFSSTPLNTYHLVYNDTTYMSYVSSDAYKKRSSTISSLGFIGANDGMLHAVRVGYLKNKSDSYGTIVSTIKALFKNFFTSTDAANDLLGEEVWAYIPYNAFPYLKYLADPTYCHIYYNDLTVNLLDVSLGGTSNPNATDVRDAGSWKTVVMGGMRFGGACSGGISPTGPPTGTPANVGFSSFYMLDVTDPENPVPLWEFTDPDLGYASSYPAVIRTGAAGVNGRWYVVLGSGSKRLPKEGQDIARSTTGYIYILDLKTGALVKKIALDHNAIVGDILAIDANMDYKSERIYFGTSYLSTTWKGKLVSIAIPDQDLSLTWTPAITYLFSGDHLFTASPDAVLDEYRNVWVYQGSGKYYSDVDETMSEPQIFLGMKHLSSTTYPLTLTNLTNRTATTTTGIVTGTTQACIYDSESGFGMKTMVTSVNATSAQAAVPANGWYVNLATSPTVERVISRPLAIGGLVDFLSYRPNSDPCAAGGDSYLYSLGYTTGVAPDNVAILSPDTTTIIVGSGGGTVGNKGGNIGDEVRVEKGIKLGPGAPPTGEAIIIPPPKEGQEKLKKKIQVATGVVVEAENETSYSLISKIVHWLKK